MTNEEIFEGLKEVLHTISPSLNLSNVTPESNLFTDMGLDSLTLMLLSIAIETRFGFTFEGTPQFSTVGEVVKFISDSVN